MNERSVAVIDLKAFYSYVECVDRGLDPFTTPLVVCDINRGKNTIILSVTPFLKSKGIPSRLRFKELPQGKFKYIYATPRMERYIQKSKEVVGAFLDFVSHEDIHIYSVDEAFIELTSYLNYYKLDAYSLTKKIIEHVNEKTDMFATGGVGSNMFLAKVALDVYAKKSIDSIGTLFKEEIPTKLWPISPLIDIWGIGPQTEKKLNKLGIYKVEQLAKYDKSVLVNMFGIMGEQLYNHANGFDESDMREAYTPKDTSLSFGQTLMRDYKYEEALTVLRELNDDLSEKLRSQHLLARVISVSIVYSSSSGGFHHQIKAIYPTNITDDLFNYAKNIYINNCQKKCFIRQIHLTYSGLIDEYGDIQYNLFENEEETKNKVNLDKTIDIIRNKYGKDSLMRLSALKEESTLKERHSFIGGHKR